MGIVYLAKDPLIGRLVALKTIRAAAHADDDETKEFQQRFIREAQAAGILNHPSIVTVHDIGMDEPTNTSFIAMEYVEGSNLKEVLAQGRPLPFDQIGDIVCQVADALDFAHAKGIVHRDVKPANIILVEGNRAKITDFGIAKIATGGNLTTTGQFLGTPNYMAPEQIKGAPVDGRTDIFSLGICLYECLTRRKPFGGDSLTSISYKIVHEPFPPLHEINPTIPDGFEEVVSRCLAKDPAKRYQRGREVAAALHAVLRGERPAPHRDPVLEEETMVTRADHRAAPMPTVEVPFPQAHDAYAPGVNTRPVSASHTAIAPAAVPAPAAKPAAPAKPPVSQQLRRTLTNVRALPLWRRRIPPAVFFGIIAILVAGLIAAVAAIRSKNVAPEPVDPSAWARAALQRQLRGEANSLLARGRVTDAYPKFEELSRLAPKSPYVQSMLERLNAMKLRDELTKAQVAQAKAKFDEGVVLFNARQFAQAIDKFQESFSINPSSVETGDYLKLAQQEQQKADAARAAARAQRLPAQTAAKPAQTTSQPPTPALVVPAAPTQLTTTFTHPFTDGRIIVRAGGDVVANEQLFEMKKRTFRRAAPVPKPVNVTHEFPAKNADVDIWVTVPAQNISEHKTLQFRFQPGSAHRLVVRYDAASKNFSYELN